MSAAGFSNIARAFRNRDYRLFQTGRFACHVTMWMYRMAIGWMVWEMTHSATWLGIFGFLDLAPALVVMPLAGALSDRWDKLRLLRWTQALLLIHAFALSFLIIFDLITIEILAAFTLYFGIVSAGQMPAYQAIVPNLVPKDDLTAAYGINSMSFNISRFIGPMIAGFVITYWGTGPAIFANAAGLLVFSVCLTLMRTDLRRQAGTQEGPRNMIRELRDGFSYAVRHPGIGPNMGILSILSILTFSIDQLLPSFADGVFGAGAHGYAWMIAIMGMGAICQAAQIARRGAIEGLTAYVIRGILILGLGFIALASTEWFWFGLVSVFFAGFAGSSVRVGSLTLVQHAVDASMRGRVASFYGVIYQAGGALGALILGALGDVVGIRVTFAIAGALVLIIWSWSHWHRLKLAAALERAADETLADSKRD